MSISARPNALRLALLALAILSWRTLFAQIATGTIAGKLRDLEGQPLKAAIMISSDLGFRATVNTDAQARFLLTLPYGRYELAVQDRRDSRSSTVWIDIEPLQNREISLVVDTSGKLRIEMEPAENAGVWSGSPQNHPEAFNFSGVMLSREPATATQPLNFAGLGDNRLG